MVVAATTVSVAVVFTVAKISIESETVSFDFASISVVVVASTTLSLESA